MDSERKKKEASDVIETRAKLIAAVAALITSITLLLKKVFDFILALVQ